MHAFPGGAVQAKQPPVDARIFRAAGEIIEGVIGRSDDVLVDEPDPFTRPVLGMLGRALPLDDCPSAKIVLGGLGEDRGEIDLTVAEGAESSGALHPWQIANSWSTAQDWRACGRWRSDAGANPSNSSS